MASFSIWKTRANLGTGTDATKALREDGTWAVVAASGGSRVAQVIASVGNDANTSEKDLLSYTLPGGTLATNGDSLILKAWVFNAANGNAKRTRIYFGATTIGDSQQTNSNGNWWYIEATVTRTSATAQLATVTAHNLATNGQAWTSAAGGGVNHTTPAETLSGDVTFRLTGTSPTTGAANDVTLIAAYVTTEDAA